MQDAHDDTRTRLLKAAMTLFAERGYETTTAAEIAGVAGVTERTFFRHFPDKREVLFDGSGRLEDLIVEAVAGAPSGAAPLDMVVDAMTRAGEYLDAERRPWSRQRAAVIAAEPDLQERELLKLASLARAVGDVLRERGVEPPTAALVADTGVVLFQHGFDRWVADPPPGDLASCVRQAHDALRAAVAAPADGDR